MVLGPVDLGAGAGTWCRRAGQSTARARARAACFRAAGAPVFSCGLEGVDGVHLVTGGRVVVHRSLGDNSPSCTLPAR